MVDHHQSDHTQKGATETNQLILAVDVGVRCGFVWLLSTGDVLRYRSRNFGSASRLKKAIPAVLREMGLPKWLVLEGGGTLATAWEHHAEKAGVETVTVHAGLWREAMLLGREQRSGKVAKDHAIVHATEALIECKNRPKGRLKHDVAEAILLGIWFVRYRLRSSGKTTEVGSGEGGPGGTDGSEGG